jgi:hypothetical protein
MFSGRRFARSWSLPLLLLLEGECGAEKIE